ncbi:MAG: hypothetical protein LUH49_07600, partial [Cloacibacillus porcorum]|nr:hypothetical protein [Cloacibacillus porcorum]
VGAEIGGGYAGGVFYRQRFFALDHGVGGRVGGWVGKGLKITKSVDDRVIQYQCRAAIYLRA